MENNVFGIKSSITDTHMMKNSEWGAVAYLSQSKYGKYGNLDYEGREKEVYMEFVRQICRAIAYETKWVDEIYVDATHLTEKARQKTINALPEGEYFITTVFFDVPLETCIERNDNRTGRAFVPHPVIRKMHASYDQNTKLGDATLHLDENGEWRGID